MLVVVERGGRFGVVIFVVLVVLMGAICLLNEI